MKKVKEQKVKFLTGAVVAAVCIMALLFSGKKENPDSEMLKIGIAVYNLDDVCVRSNKSSVSQNVSCISLDG